MARKKPENDDVERRYMKYPSELDKQFVKGGEIPYMGRVKAVMDKFDNRTLFDQAGHTILNPKEAAMDAFNQACKSDKKLLNENGRKGINVSDEAEKIFRNF
jgi:hypothetical protein